MKFLDEKGRLFGKINLIDLLVVLMLVIVIVAVAWKLGGDKLQDTLVHSNAPTVGVRGSLLRRQQRCLRVCKNPHRRSAYEQRQHARRLDHRRQRRTLLYHLRRRRRKCRLTPRIPKTAISASPLSARCKIQTTPMPSAHRRSGSARATLSKPSTLK